MQYLGGRGRRSRGRAESASKCKSAGRLLHRFHYSEKHGGAGLGQ